MSDTNITGSAVVYAMVDLDDWGFTRGVEAPNANAPAYVRRDFINFDQVQGLSEIRSYKMIGSIWPDGYVTDVAQPVTFQVGSTDSMAAPFTWSDPQIFDGQKDTEELYFQEHGRFHAWRMDYAGTASFVISGMDMVASEHGRR